ncbi:arylacetamide deacetylase-like 4 isoform X2 [Rhinatrema bivittatum]|uniref:arylacetamide deacetylase-like 4 isoform X2 n=1 Tax=Rhinatrema bivittatum TaxID=194408 RepID=UPI00112C4736|nr:arylacetamide deacetylase-like 4 isoform X2 [Rhinatrema bivittatum]XP_029434721.1 arylacetamide deacetylase-like 4 isoform X2 [Rhinatrema bivittatum]
MAVRGVHRAAFMPAGGFRPPIAPRDHAQFLTRQGKIVENLGICSQVVFTRYMRNQWLSRKTEEDPKLFIKDLTFDEVPVRIYQPKSPSSGGRRGVAYFHGGAFMFGSIKTYDSLCCYLARESDSVVVSVAYRLSPEYRYPAHFEDCLHATVHFLKAATEYGVDPASVIVGGDNAGGSLAAAVCQTLASRTDLPKPCAQVLIYPILQMLDFGLPSYQQNHSVPILYRERVIFYGLNYLNGDMSVMEEVLEGKHVPAEMRLKFRKWLSPDNIPEEFKRRGFKPQVAISHIDEVYEEVQKCFEPSFSPLLAEDATIRCLPKAYILTCEFDVLRDDGLLYKKRLEDHSIPVTWHHVKDGFHGVVTFFNKGFLHFPSGKAAVDDIVSFIKQA